MIKSGLLIAGLILLAGCASEPVSLNYYLLHSPATEEAASKEITGRLRIDKIKLPDYLKQRGLAMQTGPTTILFSSQHVWAEPLAGDFLQTLSANLWQDQGIEVFSQNIYDKAQTTGVTLVIDDFIATHKGFVVLKGQYWLFPDDGEPVSKRFFLRADQQQDGFEHTVEQMRELIAQLAAEMANETAQLKISEEPQNQ
ncbi:hypothetical protein HHX48_05065 [Salinimonas sp. HHU 13199]|uniref:ABC-type transport auxiliary lipoprotein component domain-containing protein n=1 Tax=Salinimonas profundi TaxID=2729140 RepID=A0ABR8LIQ5_9ALTE|nr:ABC-type transport auxiliary lipoprotein family protein [Salinimonas profundi]MBD3585103.1 hypothetical protein [Salinimonas profundi]